jgi:hypothetical protein
LLDASEWAAYLRREEVMMFLHISLDLLECPVFIEIEPLDGSSVRLPFGRLSILLVKLVGCRIHDDGLMVSRAVAAVYSGKSRYVCGTKFQGRRRGGCPLYIFQKECEWTWWFKSPTASGKGDHAKGQAARPRGEANI